MVFGIHHVNSEAKPRYFQNRLLYARAAEPQLHLPLSLLDTLPSRLHPGFGQILIRKIGTQVTLGMLYTHTPDSDIPTLGNHPV
jgi:hypothetical protein